MGRQAAEDPERGELRRREGEKAPERGFHKKGEKCPGKTDNWRRMKPGRQVEPNTRPFRGGADRTIYRGKSVQTEKRK